MARPREYFLKHRNGSLFLGLILASIILLGISTRSVTVNPKQVGFSVFSLLQRGVSEVGGFFSRVVNSLGELRRLRDSYEQLQDTLHDYRINERELVELRRENARLQEMLGFSESLSYEHVVAEAIGRDSGNLFTTIIINKGSAHGIVRNQPVVTYQGGFQGLVGRVVEVAAVSALVLPVYDVTCYVPGRLQKTRYTGLSRGGGDFLSLLRMTSVPKSAREQINVGDLVVTSGLSSIYPKDIYIGRVRRIGAKEWEASLELDIEPIVDFSRLEYVFVLGGAE